MCYSVGAWGFFNPALPICSLRGFVKLRAPPIWPSAQTGRYYTKIGGTAHTRSEDKAEARKAFYKLTGREKKPAGVAGRSTRKLCDLDRARESKGPHRVRAELSYRQPFCTKFGHRDPSTLKVYEVNTWLDMNAG